MFSSRGEKRAGIILCSLLLILFARTSEAKEWYFDWQEEQQDEENHKWTTADSMLEATLVVVSVVDDLQTMRCLRQGWCEELNPILRTHPSNQRIIVFSAVALATHAFIAYKLPKPERTWWQGLWIGIELVTVENNREVAVRYSTHY